MVWEGGEVDFDVVLEAGWGLLAPGGLHARRISVEFRIFDQMYRFLALYSVFLDKYSVFLNKYSVFLAGLLAPRGEVFRHVVYPWSRE